MATEAKAKKQYQPTRLEVAKTVLIAVLVTTILAFLAGVHYANGQHGVTAQAISAAVSVKK